MGLYKEEAYEIESIAKLQKQIYPDAADFGVPVSGYNDDIVKRMQEVIDILKDDFQLELNYSVGIDNRVGDHICYYSDMSKFKKDYPNWKLTYNLPQIIEEIIKKGQV